MFKLTAAVVLTVIVVAFALANAHHVELSVVFGKPLEIRLVFLLGSTYAAGAMSGSLWMLVRQWKRRRDTRLAKWSAQQTSMER